MTAFDFPLAGLTNAQWENIRALTTTLQPGQALWISGFFAGLDHQARALVADVAGSSPQTLTRDTAPASDATRSLTILYASETGNCSALAHSLKTALDRAGRPAGIADMASYKSRQLKDKQDLLVLTSTHGEGDPPQSASDFFEFIEGRRAPRLENVRYSVLALGDSTYENYCAAGKRLDQRLAELGAQRLRERVDCDVDFDEPAAAWSEAIVKELGSADAPASKPHLVASATPKPTGSNFNRQSPFSATVLDNFALTGRGSSKETRHIELSIEGSGLSFQPGDALGVWPRNDSALVDDLLASLALPPDAPITHKGQTLPLKEALTTAFEITAATPRFIEHWAAITKSEELVAFTGEGAADLWNGFLRENHVLDIVQRHPAGNVSISDFVAALRPLQPRLYSIASSQALLHDEVHLTVATVRYELQGRRRAGVASGHLADQAVPDTMLPVYVQSNPHFRLPEVDAPIIMIGAGTGIAPYRAFLQDREAQGRRGNAWLFFGERNFHTDFIYQTEWQGWLDDGTLQKMSVAFSRDHADKRYVQHRLLEQGQEVYDWLQNGAHIYVCGDGAQMAPGVHAAIASVLRQFGGRSEEQAREDLATLQRDHRYHVDVY